MIETSYLSGKKNLLAFSAGVDSSALFFLLIEKHIKFDIAIVDYGVRAQSKEEVLHAKKLAKKYKLLCHTIQAPKIKTHFEKEARDFRYKFFDSLVLKHNYDNILTAHQLNDQLEWLLMRLTKGAGVSELLGLQRLTKQKNHNLIRPLLAYSKDELLTYLHKNNHPYYIDKSNSDEKYERNRFRNQFSDSLIEQYKEGIKRSFEYLKKDKMQLEERFETLNVFKSLHIIKLYSPDAKVKAADLTLKKLGYILSASQRKEIEKHNSLVIAGAWAIELQNDLLFIAPYSTISMPKKYKETCRVLKIPLKIRPYCFEANVDSYWLVAHGNTQAT